MKIFVFGSFIFIFAILPEISSAAFIPPYFDITVNKITTNGQDGTFNFHFLQFEQYYPVYNEDFAIQTVNGTGSYPIYTIAGSQSTQYITEEITEGWELMSVSCTSSNPAVTYISVTNGVRINPVGYSTISCDFFNSPKSAQKTPVLILPGVLGTELENNEELLWANLKMANPFGDDDFMDPLALNLDLTSTDSSVKILGIVKKVGPVGLEFDYSKSLIEEFINQGYIEEQDLFTFPYDWRYGVSGKYPSGSTTVDLLKTKINEIISQTGSAKVDIIAHSTGGLLVKKYVMDNPASHNLNKVVMVGVPNLGAPKAVKVLLEGDGFGVFGLNDSEMKKLAKNMPVIYDLAPNRIFFDTKGSFVKIVEQKFLAPSNTKDLNYDESKTFLIQGHGLNEMAYNKAQDLHTNQFIDFDLRTAGVDVYNLAGCKSATIGQVVERQYENFKGDKSVSYDSPKEISGDETVPFESADSLKVDDNKEFYAKKFKHSELLSANGTRQLITNLISGSNLDIGNKIITKQQLSNDINQCEIKGKQIKILSPLDIEVFDQKGNRLGFGEDGSLQKNIPGADFNVFGDHKFIFLPEDEGETYTINLTGTGSGSFTLGITEIDGEEILGSENFVNLPVATSTIGILDLYAQQPTLHLDTDGNGSVDQTFLPSSVLDANQSQDLVPPVSTSTLNGTVGQEGFYRSNVNLQLSAKDIAVPGLENQTSELLKLDYKIDSNIWQSVLATSSNLSLTLSFEGEGNHEVSYFATDKAGNTEEPKSISFTIDKTFPEINASFNLASKDFSFSSDDVLVCQPAECTATDKAGNTTLLKFENKALPLSIKNLLFKNISYNGVLTNFEPNVLSVGYLQKLGSVTDISQTEIVKKQQLLNITYIKSKNQTTISDWRGGSKPVVTKTTGLKTLEISTTLGKIKTSIK
jgi:hypothetical protein